MLTQAWDLQNCNSPTSTVLWWCSIECSIQNFSTCKIWTNNFERSS